MLALLPVRGLLTTSRVFVVRDLGFFFWSRHLWLRHTLFGRELPLWDPYLAGGYAAYADALNQVFNPLTVAIRLLPSTVVSFNLWVALPVPIATIGTFAFLRRRHRLASAAVGACAFALSGTLVSSLNAPNLSWSLALLPWLCHAGDRLVERPGGAATVRLAIVLALQALAGEPVTLTASVLVLVVQVAASARMTRQRRRIAGWLTLALGLGAALSAVQMLPTALAGIQAGRAAWSDTPDFWSLHPLAALEVIVPHLFGNYYTTFLADMPWMTALNSGREPFFYSIYIGPLVLLLAVAGAVASPRRAAPWIALTLVFGVAAVGHYTPIYPAARRVLYPLAFFRFPIKYLAVAFFAIAVLAAHGADAALSDGRGKMRARSVAIAGALVAGVLAVFLIGALAAPSAALRLARGLASQLQLGEPEAGARFLVRFGEPLAAQTLGVLLAGATLLALAAGDSGRRRRFAWPVFLALCLADLAVANGSLNPTVEAAKMAPPSWYTAMASADRLYIGGRALGFMNPADADGSPGWRIPDEPTAILGRAVLNAELPMAPSGWRVREAVSYDLPVLLPSEYGAALRRFLEAPSSARDVFLRRAGVRWCVLPWDRDAGRTIGDVPDWQMIVTECNPSASRVFVAPAADVAADVLAQEDALFDPRVPDALVRIASAPPPAGRPSAASAASASIATAGANDVSIAVSLPRDSFVVLRDSFDPGWRAFVDGERARVVRADALYRAVHVTAGRHVIRFVYRPRALIAGLILSGSAIVICAVLVLPRRRSPRRRRADGAAGLPRRSADGAKSGFTLIELMIVMAIIGILLSIAFARYRGMRGRANEASATSGLRSITSAQSAFALTCGNGKYATTLPALAQPVPSTGQPFLSPDLTGSEQITHSGYLFQMTATALPDAQSCNHVPVGQGYAVTADPTLPGVSGRRYFGTNTDRAIYADEKQSFAGSMPETGPPEHGVEVK
jgi:prepilin-type N-terminal cleavage/methylation domain-containing protein